MHAQVVYCWRFVSIASRFYHVQVNSFHLRFDQDIFLGNFLPRVCNLEQYDIHINKTLFLKPYSAAVDRIIQNFEKCALSHFRIFHDLNLDRVCNLGDFQVVSCHACHDVEVDWLADDCLARTLLHYLQLSTLLVKPQQVLLLLAADVEVAEYDSEVFVGCSSHLF